MILFQRFSRKKVFLLLFCVKISFDCVNRVKVRESGLGKTGLFVYAFYGLDSAVFVVVNLTNFNRAEPGLSTRRD